MADPQTSKDPMAASITSAINKQNSEVSLAEIYRAVRVTNTASLLDPLTIIPLLLPCSADAATLLIQVVSENCSPKEVIVAIQEAMERLLNFIRVNGDDDSESDNDMLSPARQLERMILAYAYAIPRLAWSLKPISHTLEPLLHDLDNAIIAVARMSSPVQSRMLIRSVSAFAQTIIAWVKARVDDPTQVSQCSDLLFSVLDTVLSANANSLGTFVAQRVFESYFPKLFAHSAVDPDWESRELVVSIALDTANALGFTTDILVRLPTIGSLILLAHSNLEWSDHAQLVETFSPPVFTSIQTNVAFEETLAFLLTCFTLMSRRENPISLSMNVAIPFSVLLPPLASAHPDPAMRHLIFRLLSVMFSLFIPSYRLQIFEDILTNSGIHSSQLRVATIGLVKDSVLDALSESKQLSTLPNAFGTSVFLDRLSPVLFRPDPPTLFQSSNFDVEAFVRSPEPKRLIQCLAFYYVIVRRDKDNQTGIRGRDKIRCIEEELLRPLRQFLKSGVLDSHSRDPEIGMTIAGLQTSLARVEEALGELGIQRE